MRKCGFIDKNGILHSVVFVDTFESDSEYRDFVSSVLGTDGWCPMEI